jgi:hypothetical protein
MSLVLSGSTSGSVTLQEPAVAGTTVLDLPATSGTVITTGSSGGVSQAMLATGVAGTGPAFSAYANTGTSLSNATFTKITYDAEGFDTNNNFASSRFTPTVAGYYQISAVTRLGSISAGIVAIKVFKNGSGYASGASAGVVSGYVYPAVSTLVDFNGTTDYVEIYCYQNSGGSTTTDNGTEYTFTGVLVRAA